jgi:sporulation protein YlmC with PRC-barrel domain
MKVIGLPVFTELGNYVGKVVNLERDVNGEIKIYHIRRSGIFGFLRKRILVHPSMVVSIDKEKMIIKGPEIKIEEPAMKIKGVLVSS